MLYAGRGNLLGLFHNHSPSVPSRTLPRLHLKGLNNQRLQSSALRLLPSVAVGSQGLVMHGTLEISALCLKLFAAVTNPKENAYIIISGLFFFLTRRTKFILHLTSVQFPLPGYQDLFFFSDSKYLMGQKLLLKIKKNKVSFKDTVIGFTLPYQFMARTLRVKHCG